MLRGLELLQLMPDYSTLQSMFQDHRGMLHWLEAFGVVEMPSPIIERHLKLARPFLLPVLLLSQTLVHFEVSNISANALPRFMPN